MIGKFAGEGKNMRQISYVDAINETLHQMIEKDERVFLMGQGVTSPWYVGATTVGLIDRFPGRIIDTPVSENGITGAAVGAALAFSLLPNLKLPITPQSDNKFFDIYQNYVVQSKERDKLVACLRESGIGILISWPKPMHKHESLGLGYFHLPKTEQISTEVLSLPMYPEKHQLLRRKLK